MNFTQLHERLRLELQRRIQRRTLSVSLLARLTGLGQSHLSNFLHSRRQLSLEALDRVMFSQHISVWDLLPFDRRRADAMLADDGDMVRIVPHMAALLEPYLRPSSTRAVMPVPRGWVEAMRTRASTPRKKWSRFVGITIPDSEASAMDPILQPGGIAVIDRHYTSLADYRPNRNNIYAVRSGNELKFRYLRFTANRLVLRPHNLSVAVDLLEIPPGENLEGLIIGRMALLLSEM